MVLNIFDHAKLFYLKENVRISSKHCVTWNFLFYVGLENVKLPPKMKKRGRPKGAKTTVIGLPRKKKKTGKPTPFLKKLPNDKEKGTYLCHATVIVITICLSLFAYPIVLLWFVSPVVAELALSRKGLIEEDQVEIMPESITAFLSG